MSRALTRRRFLLGVALTGTAGIAASVLSAGLPLQTAGSRRTVVVGGGIAGATAALALAQSSKGREILLIERDPAGLRSRTGGAPFFQGQPAGPDFHQLQAAGVDIAIDEVTEIDWRSGRMHGLSGRQFAFDEIIVAPGTEARDEGIAGLDVVARHRWPAAWGSQREAWRLEGQLRSLREGGHVVLRLPAGDVSHADGLGLRAIELAAFLQRHNPTARLTVLDEAENSLARTAFTSWAETMPASGRVSWRSGPRSGVVSAVDIERGSIVTGDDRLDADVVNFIPRARAGAIARTAGLASADGWCPCDATGVRSTLAPAAFVIGDAVRIGDKSAANATRAALAAVHQVAGRVV